MKTDLPDDLTITYANDIVEHRQWLQQFGRQRLKKWEDSLKANSEAAICEANTRKFLSNQNVDVQPYEDLSKGGPDFMCTKNGKTFYVEATSISIESATKSSGLKPSSMVEDYDDDANYDEFKVHDDVEDYAFITKRICYELTNKKKINQCRKVKAPCIIVISTLHQAGDCFFEDLAVEELLTATTYYTWKNDATYEITRLENSIFLRFQKGTPNLIECARNPVSAVLLCGFGSNPPNVIGCLHPNPNYPFNRTLLSKIKFCRLADGYQKGPLKVEWI